jgi:hypothetical protein
VNQLGSLLTLHSSLLLVTATKDGIMIVIEVSGHFSHFDKNIKVGETITTDDESRGLENSTRRFYHI